MGRIELPTSPLPRECSTTEPQGQNLITTTKNTMERETGIEPVSLAWKAKVLPLNYSRIKPDIWQTLKAVFSLVEETGFEPV